MRKIIRRLGRGLTDSVLAGLYPEERDQLWYQWRKGYQVAFRYFEEWEPPAKRPPLTEEML